MRKVIHLGQSSSTWKAPFLHFKSTTVPLWTFIIGSSQVITTNRIIADHHYTQSVWWVSAPMIHMQVMGADLKKNRVTPPSAIISNLCATPTGFFCPTNLVEYRLIACKHKCKHNHSRSNIPLFQSLLVRPFSGDLPMILQI